MKPSSSLDPSSGSGPQSCRLSGSRATRPTSAPVYSQSAAASPPSRWSRVWPHLLWATVTLAAVWSLGRHYVSGQAIASTAGARAVWAQYEATIKFNAETLQRLHNHAEPRQD